MSQRKKNKPFRVPGSFKPASEQKPGSFLMSVAERHLSLLNAAEEGDADTIRHLVQGIDMNFFDDPLKTPLVQASTRGYLEVVQILLDAHIYHPERGVSDALGWSAMLGQPAVVNLLLQHCSDDSLSDENKPLLPLGMRRNKPKDYLQMLFQNEKVAGSTGLTEATLTWALSKGYTKIAEIMEGEGVVKAQIDQATVSASGPDDDIYSVALTGDIQKTQRMLEENTAHYLFNLYFRKHPFGSQKYAPIFLSTLPPNDRVKILEQVVDDDPKNQYAYDRLALAYLKDGRRREAHRRLERAMSEGNISASFVGQMTESIRMMHTSSPDGYGSTTNYVEARISLARLVDADDEVNDSNFLSVYKIFCSLREAEQQQ